MTFQYVVTFNTKTPASEAISMPKHGSEVNTKTRMTPVEL
jgi:hypothetical protein